MRISYFSGSSYTSAPKARPNQTRVTHDDAVLFGVRHGKKVALVAGAVATAFYVLPIGSSQSTQAQRPSSSTTIATSAQTSNGVTTEHVARNKRLNKDVVADEFRVTIPGKGGRAEKTLKVAAIADQTALAGQVMEQNAFKTMVSNVLTAMDNQNPKLLKTGSTTLLWVEPATTQKQIKELPKSGDIRVGGGNSINAITAYVDPNTRTVYRINSVGPTEHGWP